MSDATLARDEARDLAGFLLGRYADEVEQLRRDGELVPFGVRP